MPKRCLTLVETLIAIVLVLAIGALIFPSLMDSLDERQFESAADGTNEQLMLARAHAQATGTPVEVTYRPGTSQVQARLFMPAVPRLGAPSGDSRRSNADSTAESTGAASEFAAGFADEAAIEESWACRTIGRNVRIASRPPSAAGQSPSSFNANVGASPDDAETFETLGKGQDIRLAVFMPDGSTLVGDQVWLNDDKGRLGVFTINPWSGMPIFRRLADTSAASPDDSTADRQSAAAESDRTPSRPSGRDKAD